MEQYTQAAVYILCTGIIIFFLTRNNKKVDEGNKMIADLALNIAKEYRTKADCEKIGYSFEVDYKEGHSRLRNDLANDYKDATNEIKSVTNEVKNVNDKFVEEVKNVKDKLTNELNDIRSKCAKHEGYELALKAK